LYANRGLPDSKPHGLGGKFTKFHISNMVSGKIAGAGKGLNKPESPLKAQTQFVALSSGTERFKGSS